jgi:hypothetical protein
MYYIKVEFFIYFSFFILKLHIHNILIYMKLTAYPTIFNIFLIYFLYSSSTIENYNKYNEYILIMSIPGGEKTWKI